MTRDKSNILSLKVKEGGFVTYGENNKELTAMEVGESTKEKVDDASPSQNETLVTEVNASQLSTDNADLYGPWMIVRRGNKKIPKIIARNKKKIEGDHAINAEDSQQNKIVGSRYDILHNGDLRS